MSTAVCVEKIKMYWLARGYVVEVTLRSVPAQKWTAHSANTLGIRSDMVNGLPRGYQDHTPDKVAIETYRDVQP